MDGNALPYVILCLYMASANCNVPMMGTVTLQNALICCNALPMQYAHTNTHNPHTRSHHSKPTQTIYAHCMHHTYLHTNALLIHALSFHRNSYSSSSLYSFCCLRDTTLDHTTSSAPPTLNVYLPISNMTSVEFTCMSDCHFQS